MSCFFKYFSQWLKPLPPTLLFMYYSLSSLDCCSSILFLLRTLNRLANLAKWMSCVVITYLYGGFDCILLSCHVRVSEWIYTLLLPECQGTPCLKQVPNLKFKWVFLSSQFYDFVQFYQEIYINSVGSEQHGLTLSVALIKCLSFISVFVSIFILLVCHYLHSSCDFLLHSAVYFFVYCYMKSRSERPHYFRLSSGKTWYQQHTRIITISSIVLFGHVARNDGWISNIRALEVDGHRGQVDQGRHGEIQMMIAKTGS